MKKRRLLETKYKDGQITRVTIILKWSRLNFCQFNRMYLHSFNIVVTQFALKCYFRIQYSYIQMQRKCVVNSVKIILSLKMSIVYYSYFSIDISV